MTTDSTVPMVPMIKERALRETLASISAVVVAYSGGVDSAYLAYVAHGTLGEAVRSRSRPTAQAILLLAPPPDGPRDRRAADSSTRSSRRTSSRAPRIPREPGEPGATSASTSCTRTSRASRWSAARWSSTATTATIAATIGRAGRRRGNSASEARSMKWVSARMRCAETFAPRRPAYVGRSRRRRLLRRAFPYES